MRLAWLFLFTALLNAAPTVERVFPLGGQRGTVVSIEISGEKRGLSRIGSFGRCPLAWLLRAVASLS